MAILYTHARRVVVFERYVRSETFLMAKTRSAFLPHQILLPGIRQGDSSARREGKTTQFSGLNVTFIAVQILEQHK